MTYVPAALRREVIERAGNRCEYCRLTAEVAFYPHEVDHVVAENHGGTTDINNLAFACWRCNRHKGGVRWGRKASAGNSQPSIRRYY